MSAQCVRCGKPMADTALVCPAETARAAEQLRQIVDMVPAARDIAHGLSRRGGGGASGKPGSRLPLDLTATSKLDAVQNELTTWMRHIAEERGVEIPARTINAPAEIIVEAAEWLQGHLEWLRHRQEVSEALSGIAAAARVVAGIARGPGSQKYLGPCGAFIVESYERSEVMGVLHEAATTRECDGDIYARVYADGTVARAGACRICRATVVTDERTAWLDGEVRGHAFRAAQIAEAYGVNVNTIRTWGSRPRPDTGVPALASYWRTDAGLITPWIEAPAGTTAEERAAIEAARGPRLHYVGDVLDLAEADAVRRHELQVKRAQRAAARAVESEDAA